MPDVDLSSLLAAMVNPNVDVYRFTREGREDADQSLAIKGFIRHLVQ